MICALTCTYNRNACLSRAIRMFLDQECEEEHMNFIFNNSPFPIQLNLNENIPEHKKIILINSKKSYNNVGEVFNDALSYLKKYPIDILCHQDDDDIYFTNYLEEGRKGMKKAYTQGKLAYKPYYSYYRDNRGISKVHNTMEPSIFCDFAYLSKTGYKNTVVDYNQGWLDPLIDQNKLFEDRNGISTFLYDWSGEIPVFKISGAENNEANFHAHHRHSNDIKQIVTPITKEKAQEYYNLV